MYICAKILPCRVLQELKMAVRPEISKSPMTLSGPRRMLPAESRWVWVISLSRRHRSQSVTPRWGISLQNVMALRFLNHCRWLFYCNLFNCLGGGQVGMFQFNPSVNSIDPSGPQDVTHIPLSVIIPEPMTRTSVFSELVFVFDKVKIKACRFACSFYGFDCGLIKICLTETPLLYIYFHCTGDPDFTHKPFTLKYFRSAC